MSFELRPTEYVSEFVSGGPNNYAYKLIDTMTDRTNTVSKSRGVTLNYNTKQLVNFGVIRNMILGMGNPQ